MFNGKHTAKRSLKFTAPGKTVLTIVSVVLALTLIVGGTAAFYMESALPISNLFNAAEGPDAVLNEDFTSGDTVKSNVTVTNTGDTPGYIRCAVTYSLQGSDGSTAARVPVADEDYTVTYGTDWIAGDDGFFYYKAPVSPNGATTALIVECETMNTSEKLVVDIAAQTVQATPSAAVNALWADNPLELE